MGFIYKITSPSNKPYVGQTRRKVPEKRWKEHVQNSLSGNSHCTALGNAIRKYGAENMKFEVIEPCPDDMLNEREHYWIEKLNSLSPNGYNLRSGGGVNEFCEEAKERMRATQRQKSIEERGYVGCITKNHSGSFATHGTDGAYLGTFSSLEEAEMALREYTRDAENYVPVLSRRKPGTGSVTRVREKWHSVITQNKETTRVGIYETKKEAEDALEKYLNALGESTSAKSRQYRKLGAGGICTTPSGRLGVSYKGKYLGTFDTQDEAEDAIERYKRDPDTFVAPHHKRKMGTGSVYMKRHRWAAAFGGKHLGTFDTQEEANGAIERYKRDPQNAPPARRTGTVRARQSGRWEAKYKEEYLGTFDTQEEATDAIERYKQDPDTFVAPPHNKRKMGTGGVRVKGHRWEATFGKKYLGGFDSRDEAEAAIQAHIASQTV